jgi:hypothetical protein
VKIFYRTKQNCLGHIEEKAHKNNFNLLVGFEVLTAMTMKCMVFWVVLACSAVRLKHFIGRYCFHLLGRESKARN